MEIMTGLGWIVSVMLPALSPVGTMVTEETSKFNMEFVQSVDSGDSCFDRIGGTVGTYGKPSDYSLDLICNYRLRQVTKEGTYKEWHIERAI